MYKKVYRIVKLAEKQEGITGQITEDLTKEEKEELEQWKEFVKIWNQINKQEEK